MQTRFGSALPIFFAAIVPLASLVTGQDGLPRKLLQMDSYMQGLAGGLMGAGQEGGDTCLSKGSSLVNGPCAPFVQAFKSNADAIVHADEVTFNHAVQTAPKPQPQCCVDATAFVTGGCSCDASVVSFAPYMGLNSNALITIARAATIVCAIPSNPCVAAPVATAAALPTPVAQAVAVAQPAAGPIPVRAAAPVPALAPLASAPTLTIVAAAAPSVSTEAPMPVPHATIAAPMPQMPLQMAPIAAPVPGPGQGHPMVMPVQPIPLGQAQQPMHAARPQPMGRYAFEIPSQNAGSKTVTWLTKPGPSSTLG